MLKVIRTVLYIISGFFAFLMNFIAFISMPGFPIPVKFYMMATSGIIGLLILLIAMATSRFKAWTMPLGITFLSAVGCLAITIFTQICIEASPQLFQSFPDYPHNFFSDYITGGITTICFFLVGLGLVQSSAKQEVVA